jgi:hypothetical protein
MHGAKVKKKSYSTIRCEVVGTDNKTFVANSSNNYVCKGKIDEC